MSSYDRINELKKLNSITESNNISVSDLLLKDEDGQSYLDYIIENNISIFSDSLIKKISNDYDILFYMINNNYFLSKYDNVDLLFDNSRGKSLIELFFEKKAYKVACLGPDIINRLFWNVSGKYLIEDFINKNIFASIEIIKKVTNFNILFACLSKIERLDLMINSNENCLLTEVADGKTLLELLIDAGCNLDATDKSYRVADILYNKKQYNSMLKLDCSILLNYPEATSNYLQLLIQRYKDGENVPFENVLLNAKNSRDLAVANIMLLRNGISYGKPYSLIGFFDSGNYGPVIIHMLKIDKELTLQYYGSEALKSELKRYISNFNDVEITSLDDLNVDNISDYLPNVDKFKQDLLAGRVKEIKKNDIFRNDFLELMPDGSTILEYVLKHGIKKYIYKPESVEEVIIFLKCKERIFSVPEKLLYEKVDNVNSLIDILYKDKYFDCIRLSQYDDLRIIDYCIKYNDFSIIGNHIMDELLVQDEKGNFPIEKYLNNDSLMIALENYTISDDKILKLYDKGYQKVILYSDLEILMNRPSKEYNYLQQLIDEYKKGIDIKFESRNYIYNDKEVMARCYIQMAKNGLIGYLNDLGEEQLLDNGNSPQNLLYYLMTIDKAITERQILRFDMRKNPKIFAELKILNGDEGLLDVAYEKFDCDRICRKMYNDEYALEIVSPCEDLLKKLQQLFYNDGKSDRELVDALVVSYRHATSVNPLFVQELQQLIQIKQRHPEFHYINEPGNGYFSSFKNGVFMDSATISTLNHETGHAMHYYLTDNEIPLGYDELLLRIMSDPTFVERVEQYSKQFMIIRERVEESASVIVSKYISSNVAVSNKDDIVNLLSYEKEQLIKKYIEKGYSMETLDVVLSGTFTMDEFLSQKSEIEKVEVKDLIMRYDYDAFIAIGDIIDAITNGKFRSDLLCNKDGKIIKSAFGHGIRYYSRNDSLKFCEMIANYVSIIKSKQSEEMLTLLRQIVGDELVSMLDVFYTNKILASYEKEKSVIK